MASESSKLPTKREFSSGGVVFKRVDDKIVWLVGKHSGYNKWVLPKGMIEAGETSKETAVREVEEETGVRAKIVGEEPIHTEEYWFVAEYKQPQSSPSLVKACPEETEGRGLGGVQTTEPQRRVNTYQEAMTEAEKQQGDNVKVFKTVTFYLMEYESGDPSQHDWEMGDAGWFEFEEVLKLLAFEGEREALKQAQAKLRGNLLEQ